MIELLLRSLEGLVKVCRDVDKVFVANADADHVLLDAGRSLVLIAELLVRRARGVDDESLGVTDVGEVRRELDIVDELASSRDATLDAEREDSAIGARAEVLFRSLVRRMGLEARVRHPLDELVILQPLRQLIGVLGVRCAAERKRLQTLQQQEGAKGVCASAQITQRNHASAKDECEVALEWSFWAKDCVKVEAVVSFARLVQKRELGRAVHALDAPVKRKEDSSVVIDP